MQYPTGAGMKRVRTMSNRSQAGPRDYPHYIVQVWGGRLPTPPEYRGTPVAKQFESGRIGGRKIIDEHRISDTRDGRMSLYCIVRGCRDYEIYLVRSARHARERISSGTVLSSTFVERGLPRR